MPGQPHRGDYDNRIDNDHSSQVVAPFLLGTRRHDGVDSERVTPQRRRRPLRDEPGATTRPEQTSGGRAFPLHHPLVSDT